MLIMNRFKLIIALFYPVIERGTTVKAGQEISDSKLTIGMAIQFPENNIQTPITFGVRDSTKPDEAIVSS